MSAPASATVRIWSIVAARLAVSVLVIVCTATGAPPPIGTAPTWIWRSEAMPGLYLAQAPRPARTCTCPTSTPPRADRWRAWPRRSPPAPARAGTRALRAHGAAARGTRPRRGLRARRPARARAGLDITGVDLVERPDYPGPFVRADAADGLPVRRRRVRPRLLLERDRARPAAAPRRLRRRAAARRARLVRADARLLVPDRAARAAAGRALAAGRAAPALLAAGRGRRLGGDRAAAPRARWRRCSGRPAPSASARS